MMKKADIYEIAIKLLGLYLFYKSIDLLNGMLATVVLLTQAKENMMVFGDVSQTPILLLTIGNFLTVIVLASFLTWKTKTIVSWICRPADYEDTAASLPVSKEVIYEGALVLLGLIVVVWTLPEFLVKLKEHIDLVQSDTPRNQYDINFVLTSAIKIALGLLSIIYAKSLALILVKRSARAT